MNAHDVFATFPGILQSLRRTAVIMLAASGVLSLPAEAVIILKPPPEFETACDAAAPKSPLDTRVKNFWTVFAELLYSSSAPPEVRTALGPVYQSVLPAWKAWADAPASRREAERQKWLAAANAAAVEVGGLSRYQLFLMRCFFPSPSSASGINGSELARAFELLALGTNAAEPGRPDKGRMDGIGAWIDWFAFAQAAEATGKWADDVAAWQSLERMSLYGLLLHAHHDSRPCPSPQCQQRRDLIPTGMASTDRNEILRFVGAADVQPTVLALYAKLNAGRPPVAPRTMLPVMAVAPMAQAASGPTARTPPTPTLEARVQTLEKDVADLQLAVNSLKEKYGFVVLAFFEFKGAVPKELNDLKKGHTSGLPTIEYNWDCNPCRKIGNMHVRRGTDAAGLMPAGWTYSHVASKTFPSGREAEQWVQHSQEAAFIRQHAKMIMTVTVTDYTPN